MFCGFCARLSAFGFSLHKFGLDWFGLIAVAAAAAAVAAHLHFWSDIFKWIIKGEYLPEAWQLAEDPICYLLLAHLPMAGCQIGFVAGYDNGYIL